jgi:RimJ/RimL family protein N-acetyltransferase
MHKLKKVFSILRDHYHSLSFPEFIRFLRNSLFQSWKMLIYCISLDGLNPVDQKVSNIPIVKGEISDLEAGRKRLERVPWEFKCDLYDGVKDFFICKKDGMIGHINWVYYRESPNRLLKLGEKECEAKFGLTLPQYRGRGMQPAALRKIQQYLQEKGYEKCFACVKEDNTSSIRGIEKAGFRQVGEMRFRKIFGVQVSRRIDTTNLTVGGRYE